MVEIEKVKPMVADAREQRGLVIAAKCKIVRRGDVWIVPSQSDSEDKYTVRIDAESARCTCPDHEQRNAPANHVADRMSVQRGVAR